MTDTAAELDTIETLTATARETLADTTRDTYRVADDVADTAERIAHAAARIAGGEYRPAYNGHINRETWSASLWIDNDAATNDAAREIVRGAFADYSEPVMLAEARGDRPADELARDRHNGAIHDAADALRDWYDELYAPADTASPLSDAWTYTVARVDWRAVAEGIAEGFEPAELAPDADDSDDD